MNKSSKVLASAILFLSAIAPARAALPGSGTASLANPLVSWDGELKVATGSATCNGASDPACDNFQLTVLAPSDPFTVEIRFEPTSPDGLPAGDWDMQIFDPSGSVIGSSGNSPGQAEVVVLNSPASGTYTVAGAPFAPTAGYAASASLALQPGGGTGSGGEGPSYANYTDPSGRDNGEPSIGVNWQSEIEDNGGSAMYISGLQTLRVRFDDCTSPASLREENAAGDKDWIDVSPLSHVASLDPIIFTDPETGRTFSSQLAGKTSLLESTDDDGENWLQCSGSGINSGVDHQTIGGGPLAPPLTGGTALYPNGVYYCSQDAAVAQCGLSIDGCRTFGAANPIYNLTECGGLHGHLKVAPDGTAFVPNKSCGGEQGVAVSTDNGITWTVNTIPGSVSGTWDPSVGIGTDGTVYFGFGNGDGEPMASVSTNGGTSWSTPAPLGAAFGIKDTAFASVVAGDGDRAAIAFLGTTTPNSSGDNPNHSAAWYLYVATTYDRGATWSTVNVTPGDPVQRGTICSGGFGGCDNGTRNLLDFMDIQVDLRGRPLVAYADGCVGECVNNPLVNTLAAVSKIARLKDGKGLFSAFDAPPGPPSTPLVSAAAIGSDVDLTWDEPAANGEPITGYNVYRETATSGGLDLIGQTAVNVRRLTDVGGNLETDPLYEVRAVNALGESITKSGCFNLVGPGGSGIDPGDPCSVDGLLIAIDPSGDEEGLTATAAHDIISVAISERAEDLDGNSMIDEKIFTILKVSDLSDLPANTIWRTEWTAPNGTVYFTSMRTGETPQVVAPTFSYGWLDTSTGSIYRTVADADYGSFSGDGAIRIAVSLDKFDVISGAGGATGMGPGATLNAVQASTNTLIGVVGSGLLQTNDETVAGTYYMIGNEACVNQAPSAVDDTAATDIETAVVIDVLANDTDPENDPLSLQDAGPAANGSVAIVTDAGGQKVEYTPAAGFSGTDTFNYTISDGQGNTASAEVTVIVNEVIDNHDPEPLDDAASTNEGQSVVIAVLANDSDPDDDPLTVSSVTQPTHGSTAINPDSTVTYTPNPGFFGVDTFSYTASDGRGGTADATVTVTVHEEHQNTAPQAANDAATTDENVAVTISVLANDSDADGDSLTVSGTSQPAHGDAVVNGDATVTYTPNAGFIGTDAFTYTISDGRGGSAGATVSVMVQSTNQGPIAVNDYAVADEDMAVTVAVLANDSDPDGDSLTVSGVSQPANGLAEVNGDDSITYTPDGGFFGTDAFTYMISDGRGGSAGATVSVNVRATGNGGGGSDSDSHGDSDSEDADSDGVPNDEDSDDDNDGVSDDQDSDDDGDGIEDEFDSPDKKEKKSKKDDAAAPQASTSYTLAVEDETLLLMALVESTRADMLTVEFYDPTGSLVATSVPGPDRVLATTVPLSSGDYTVTVRNAAAEVVEYKVTLIGQVPWPAL
jgi:hypothetical protein